MKNQPGGWKSPAWLTDARCRRDSARLLMITGMVLLAGCAAPRLEDGPAALEPVGGARPAASADAGDLPGDANAATYFSGGIELNTAEGLICAGQLRAGGSDLKPGAVIPIECADGTSGKVKIASFTGPQSAAGIVEFPNAASREIAIKLGSP